MKTTYALFALFVLTAAKPTPENGVIAENKPVDFDWCSPANPEIDTTDGDAMGTHPTVGTSTCIPSNNKGCSLDHMTSYSVGVATNIGGAPKTPFLPISFSVTFTNAKGTTDGSQQTCMAAPKGSKQWTCALKVTPRVVHVVGKQFSGSAYQVPKVNGQPGPCPPFPSSPYDVEYPKLYNNEPLIVSELCACKDSPGWDSKGAPAPCPVKCGDPGSPA